METRRFGRTGHHSSVAILGGVAFLKLTQPEADVSMALAMDAGVNHIDVAPEYGLAQQRLGPWMARFRDKFFLGCKTLERSKEGAEQEFIDSLQKLQVDYFDLYQLHAVNTFEDLDRATSPGGALEKIISARQNGLTRFIGITAHGIKAPAILLEALRRFDFDSILFPINFIQYADPMYREQAEALIEVCRKRDVGVMTMKAICRGPYDQNGKIFNTMYLPFTAMEEIQKGVNFVLSQAVTGLCTVGEASLLPLVLKACQNYQRLNGQEQADLIEKGKKYPPFFK